MTQGPWKLEAALRMVGRRKPGLKSTPLVRADGRECTTLSVDVTGPTGKRWRLTERVSRRPDGGWTEPELRLFATRGGNPGMPMRLDPDKAARVILGYDEFEKSGGYRKTEHAQAYAWVMEWQ